MDFRKSSGGVAATGNDVATYLKMPYARVVTPENDGTFRAEILEFPGCLAVGDTAREALNNLDEVAASWLQVTLARGQKIPEPAEEHEYSGKLVLRLPKSLHRKAAVTAKREGVSLNHLIVAAIGECVGEARTRVSSAPEVLPAATVRILTVSQGSPWGYRSQRVDTISHRQTIANVYGAEDGWTLQDA